MPKREPDVTRRARSRERLLDAAAGLLAERGWAGTNLAEVARAAGLAPATLYLHFESKNQLTAAVCAPLFAGLFEQAERVAARGDVGLDDIRAHLETLVGIARRHQALMSALVSALNDQVARSAVPTGPEDPRLVLPLPRPLAQLLSAAQDAGHVVAGVATDDVATYTVNALMLRVLTRPTESAQATSRLVLALLLPALTTAQAWVSPPPQVLPAATAGRQGSPRRAHLGQSPAGVLALQDQQVADGS